MPAVHAASGDVSLTIPAKPGYLLLARLALDAVCRLTPLNAGDVADLKLAVTEAASSFVAAGDEDDTVAFDIRLHRDRIAVELTGPTGGAATDELELSRSIIEATVDEVEFLPGRTVLAKRLVG